MRSTKSGELTLGRQDWLGKLESFLKKGERSLPVEISEGFYLCQCFSFWVVFAIFNINMVSHCLFLEAGLGEDNLAWLWGSINRLLRSI